MKLNARILSLLILLVGVTTAFAQTEQVSDSLTLAGRKSNICEHLAATGRVSIKQDARFENLLSRESINNRQEKKATKEGYIVTSGFRIRVFSGNKQIESKNRAYQLAKDISSKFPDLATYITFKTPNWRLIVGDFRTMEEAHAQLNELKKKFPTSGREMFIVRDEIELPCE